MSDIEKILREALAFESTEKLKLIDKLLASFYPLNEGVEKVWADEAEERIGSHENGHLPVIDEENTFSKYKR